MTIEIPGIPFDEQKTEDAAGKGTTKHNPFKGKKEADGSPSTPTTRSYRNK